MKKNKDYNYFDAFVTAVGYCCASAEKLSTVIENYSPDHLSGQMKEMHEIEHQADIDKHDMMDRLLKEFITPIEREDIMSLSHEIDEVTDRIEDVLMGLYIFNVQTLHKDAVSFTGLIQQCCQALKKVMEEFHHFRKAPELMENIITINTLEEEGDKLYMHAIRNLYKEKSDPVEMLIWTEMFNRFERCCDACEHAANVVESVVMKNT